MLAPGVEVAEETVVATPYISAVLCFAVARFEGAVETAVASRYIRLCYISAKFRLHPRRERACPFRLLWFRRHPPVGLTQKTYRHRRKNATKKVRHEPHTIIIHY